MKVTLPHCGTLQFRRNKWNLDSQINKTLRS